MKITINNTEITIKHTLRTTMYWEYINNKAFSLSGTGDVLKYMYVCASLYNELNVDINTFIDVLKEEDIEAFLKEIQGEAKKKSLIQRILQRLKSLLSLR